MSDSSKKKTLYLSESQKAKFVQRYGISQSLLDIILLNWQVYFGENNKIFANDANEIRCFESLLLIESFYPNSYKSVMCNTFKRLGQIGENSNAYLSKTALPTIVGIEGSQAINVGDTQSVSVSFSGTSIDATTGEATLGDLNAIVQSVVEKNSITSTFKI